MQGLAEAVKDLKLVDYFDKGKRAYMLGIEKRDNPERTPSARNRWELGWDYEAKRFGTQMQRWRGEDRAGR